MPENRLHERIQRIMEEGFAFYERHAQAGTADALPHWKAALSAFAKINAPYKGKLLITYLIELLEEDEKREWVIPTLGDMGAHTAEAVPALLAFLENEYWSVSEALGKIGTPEALEGLVECLSRPDVEEIGRLELYAIKALGRMGKKAAKAIPVIFQRLRQADWCYFSETAKALKNIGCCELVPLLLERLKENESIRRSVIDALGAIKAVEAVPSLLLCLEDEDFGVSSSAIEALGRIESMEAIPALRSLMAKEEYWGKRVVTAEALVRLGADEGMSFLLEELTNKDWRIREGVIETLSHLKEQAAEAVPRLIACLEDASLSHSHDRIVFALGRIGTKAEEASPKLLELIVEANRFTRAYVQDALEEAPVSFESGRPIREMTPKLVEVYHFLPLRDRAIWALGCIRSQNAVPRLIELAKDWNGNEEINRKAVLALARISSPEATPIFMQFWKQDFEVSEAVGEMMMEHKWRIFEHITADMETEWLCFHAKRLGRGVHPFPVELPAEPSMPIEAMIMQMSAEELAQVQEAIRHRQSLEGG